MPLPDGRIARVRECDGRTCRVRVRRTTSKTHQFLELPAASLEVVQCPRGWMSPEGYERYLRVTLQKLRVRQKARRHPSNAEAPGSIGRPRSDP